MVPWLEIEVDLILARGFRFGLYGSLGLREAPGPSDSLFKAPRVVPFVPGPFHSDLLNFQPDLCFGFYFGN